MNLAAVRFISMGLVWGTLVVAVSPAWAVKQFKERFEKRYVRSESSAPNDVAFREAYEKAGCNVCHSGESKKNRNAYGKALNRFLEKSDKDDTEKIDAALLKVESMPSKPDDPRSPTFGELIRQGRLPAAE